MEQTDKVIKGLECHMQRGACGDDCPYEALWVGPATCSEPLAADALSLIRAQQARIKELEAAQKWISVKDRLPQSKDGMVLVCMPDVSPYNLTQPYPDCKINRRVGTAKYDEFSKRWYYGDMCGVGGPDPIAWMPLPEPPKEEP